MLVLTPGDFALALASRPAPSPSNALVIDEMQLADELPMIYTVCILAYATFSYKRPVKVQILVGAALIGLAVFITVSANYFVLIDGY